MIHWLTFNAQSTAKGHTRTKQKHQSQLNIWLIVLDTTKVDDKHDIKIHISLISTDWNHFDSRVSVIKNTSSNTQLIKSQNIGFPVLSFQKMHILEPIYNPRDLSTRTCPSAVLTICMCVWPTKEGNKKSRAVCDTARYQGTPANLLSWTYPILSYRK